MEDNLQIKLSAILDDEFTEQIREIVKSLIKEEIEKFEKRLEICGIK